MARWSLLVPVVGPLLALVLHELTHFAAARLFGPVKIEQHSLIPFRLKITSEAAPSDTKWRFIAVAPFLCGLCIGAAVIASGGWDIINSVGAFYVPRFLLLSWLVYSHISPADARVVLNPGHEK